MANNLGLDPFPDPVGHFVAPWRPQTIELIFMFDNKKSVNTFIQQ